VKLLTLSGILVITLILVKDLFYIKISDLIKQGYIVGKLVKNLLALVAILSILYLAINMFLIPSDLYMKLVYGFSLLCTIGILSGVVLLFLARSRLLDVYRTIVEMLMPLLYAILWFRYFQNNLTAILVYLNIPSAAIRHSWYMLHFIAPSVIAVTNIVDIELITRTLMSTYKLTLTTKNTFKEGSKVGFRTYGSVKLGIEYSDKILFNLILGHGLKLKFKQPSISGLNKVFNIGKYSIKGFIGKGGFAVTLLAVDDVGRNFAIKVPVEVLDSILYGVTFVLDKNLLEAFLRELEVMRSVSHPHIVSVIDGDVYANIPFIVLEFCENGSLRNVLELQGRLNINDALILGIQLADALAYLHSKGIIHRDLKPENILFTRDGVAKITDFNISKVMSTVSTSSRSKSYTLGYAAPEQLFYDLGPTSDRTDVWSLGIVLYEAITGRKPFSVENYIDEIRKEQLDLSPLPEEVRPIISQMLNVKPSDRPPITYIERELLRIFSNIYNV